MTDPVFFAHALAKKDITITKDGASRQFHELTFTGRRSESGPLEDITIRVKPQFLKSLLVVLSQLSNPPDSNGSKTPTRH